MVLKHQNMIFWKRENYGASFSEFIVSVLTFPACLPRPYHAFPLGMVSGSGGFHTNMAQVLIF